MSRSWRRSSKLMANILGQHKCASAYRLPYVAFSVSTSVPASKMSRHNSIGFAVFLIIVTAAAADLFEDDDGLVTFVSFVDADADADDDDDDDSDDNDRST